MWLISFLSGPDGLTDSKTEAIRLIQSGYIYIDDVQVTDVRWFSLGSHRIEYRGKSAERSSFNRKVNIGSKNS